MRVCALCASFKIDRFLSDFIFYETNHKIDFGPVRISHGSSYLIVLMNFPLISCSSFFLDLILIVKAF